MSKPKRKDYERIDKDNFIDFLSSASPEEINQLISERGKPPKLIEPMFFFGKHKSNKENK